MRDGSLAKVHSAGQRLPQLCRVEPCAAQDQRHPDGPAVGEGIAGDHDPIGAGEGQVRESDCVRSGRQQEHAADRRVLRDQCPIGARRPNQRFLLTQQQIVAAAARQADATGMRSGYRGSRGVGSGHLARVIVAQDELPQVDVGIGAEARQIETPAGHCLGDVVESPDAQSSGGTRIDEFDAFANVEPVENDLALDPIGDDAKCPQFGARPRPGGRRAGHPVRVAAEGEVSADRRFADLALARNEPVQPHVGPGPDVVDSQPGLTAG